MLLLFCWIKFNPPLPERECPGAPVAALGSFISVLNFWDQRSSCARAVPGEGGLHQKHPSRETSTEMSQLEPWHHTLQAAAVLCFTWGLRNNFSSIFVFLMEGRTFNYFLVMMSTFLVLSLVAQIFIFQDASFELLTSVCVKWFCLNETAWKLIFSRNKWNISTDIKTSMRASSVRKMCWWIETLHQPEVLKAPPEST